MVVVSFLEMTWESQDELGRDLNFVVCQFVSFETFLLFICIPIKKYTPKTSQYVNVHITVYQKLL